MNFKYLNLALGSFFLTGAAMAGGIPQHNSASGTSHAEAMYSHPSTSGPIYSKSMTESMNEESTSSDAMSTDTTSSATSTNTSSSSSASLSGSRSATYVYDNAALIDAATEADLDETTHHTTIIDARNGSAEGVNIKDRLIHVYSYTGDATGTGMSSSGSTFSSTEDWSSWTPSMTSNSSQRMTRASRSQTTNNSITSGGGFNINFVSTYVQRVDACLEAGNVFNHAKEMCEN